MEEDNLKTKNRGSEWRKWDLHVHSPKTFLGNKFKGCSNDNFSTKIKKEDVQVIGLTNYFKFDDKDFELKNYLEKKQITVFLNLELRLTYQNKDKENCDLHIIFDNNIKKDKINGLLQNLTAKVETKEIKCIQLSEDDFQKAVIEFETLLDTLEDQSLDLQEKYLIGFLSRGRGNNRTSTTSNSVEQKSHFILHSSDSERNIKVDRRFWLSRGKPLLQGSDAHELETIGNKFTWIKADPTFEGLKQIIYEPEERIEIGANRPEEKTGYQVIDSISIKQNKTLNQTIELNPNLNTIIGGRSTGKSTLLKIIAGNINEENLKEEDNFASELIEKTTIIWQDNEENQNRDIDYFSQGYMHDVAKDKDKKNDLIAKIVKEKKENKKLEKYNNFCKENKSNIHKKLDSLFGIQSEIDELINDLKEKGNKKGIESEIKKLDKKKRFIIGNSNFSNNDLKEFEKTQKEITKHKNLIQKLESDQDAILNLKTKPLFDDSLVYEFDSISDDNRKKVEMIFNSIKEEAESTWETKLDQELSKQTKEIKRLEISIKQKEKKDIYIKGKKYLKQNKQADELNKRLEKEQKKIQEIIDIEKARESLETHKNELFAETINLHTQYFNEIDKLIKGFNLKHGGIDLKIGKSFEKERCKNLMKDFINLSLKGQKPFIQSFIDDYENNIQEKAKSFLEQALESKIFLKEYKDMQDLSEGLLTANWFDISYELTYENDRFDNMSDGKKAFVILKLLLDFSDKKCPILIDQPEDSLDNRAIYNELVSYIKKKKKERQIILVTHNANVVVNADAEEIIVANQHGEDSKNAKNIKFQYISGSLENTRKNDKKQIVLEAQGIREHICDILEGGKIAFEMRKKKYNF